LQSLPFLKGLICRPSQHRRLEDSLSSHSVPIPPSAPLYRRAFNRNLYRRGGEVTSDPSSRVGKEGVYVRFHSARYRSGDPTETTGFSLERESKTSRRRRTSSKYAIWPCGMAICATVKNGDVFGGNPSPPRWVSFNIAME
jgi:hypothetical protein